MLTTVNSQSISSTGFNVYDDSLTNLSWLHDINRLKRTIPTINNSNDDRKDLLIHPNDLDDCNDFNIENDEQWRIYRNNPHAKPVYSYSQLILLAMKQSGHEKLTLQMIYEWVAENFPYFNKMEPTWQNSIRHNLSLNKWFVKVARTRKETGGKGGFWKLSPDYERKYRLSNSSIKNNLTLNKRLRPTKRANLLPDSVKPLIKNSLRKPTMNLVIKSEASIDPSLSNNYEKTVNMHPMSYIRMPSSLLSPISSPDAFSAVSSNHQLTGFCSILPPSPSTSPSSMPSATNKQNYLPTKFDEAELLLLDSAVFDWDAYLYETPNDVDVQPLLTSKTELDIFNEFNAALTDLTSSAEAVAGGDSNAFEAFDYPIKSSTYNSLFEDDEQQQQTLLSVKGHGIKRPSWWLTNQTTTTKLPSLETAFDLKLPK